MKLKCGEIMANKGTVIFPLIILFFMLPNAHSKNEKIRFFLTNYEITKASEVEGRVPVNLANGEDSEKSFAIAAFGNTFILDLSFYYPKEDSELSYITKLKNVSDSFLSSGHLLYYGFVRDVENSYVVGFCANSEKWFFRGYIFTDEIYSVEPYSNDSLIVYRFKDVIVPGCSKLFDGEDLDCSETHYFTPWKANKPPKKPPKNTYRLFYDKYFELLSELQAKVNTTGTATSKSNSKVGGKGKADGAAKTKSGENSKGHHDDGKGHHKEDTGKHKGKVNHTESKDDREEHGTNSTSKTHRKDKAGAKKDDDRSRLYLEENEDSSKHENFGKSPNRNVNKSDEYEGGHKFKDFHKESKDDRDEHETNSTDKIYRKDEAGIKEDHSDKNTTKNVTENSHKKENRSKQGEQKKKDEENGDNDLFIVKELKSAEFDKYVNGDVPGKNSKDRVLGIDTSFEGIYPRTLLESDEGVENRRSKVNLHPIAEALKDITELQCDVEVVVGPSFRKKFQDSDEKVMKDIYTQFTLLNKVFHKVTLERNGVPFRLSFAVGKIVIYGDEAYNPLPEHGDLEYFTRTYQREKRYCLTIGLVNQFLVSGQLFDGYIPEAGGGVCAYANTLIISHGNDNTPAPMALFFSALVRGVTRALGANDRDSQCEEGSYPNPMKVLQDYLLGKEIKPSSQYSLFTSCNVKEIDQALHTKSCLIKIPSSLCGNAIVDEGEACDCGPTVFCTQIDPCCTPPHKTVEKNKAKQGCVLVKGAECGSSQKCCTGCTILKGKNKCYSGHSACDVAMCDGKSADCPTGVEASNGMICSDFNETMPEPLLCQDGQCGAPLCSGYGLRPCSCAPGTGRDCVYCCAKDGKCRAAGSELKLIEGRDFILPDGMECIGGMCISGKCSALTGEREIWNFTLLKPPKLPTVFSASNTNLSALTTIISSLLSLLAQFLF